MISNLVTPTVALTTSIRPKMIFRSYSSFNLWQYQKNNYFYFHSNLTSNLLQTSNYFRIGNPAYLFISSRPNSLIFRPNTHRLTAYSTVARHSQKKLMNLKHILLIVNHNSSKSMKITKIRNAGNADGHNWNGINLTLS